MYLHKGLSSDLPVIKAKGYVEYKMDLNRIPFVLQKKGEPLYPRLEMIYQAEGLEGLCREIDRFVFLISERMAKNIADGDRDVEHNWGYVEGRLFHLDPGRLYYDSSLTEEKRRQKEWEKNTHDLQKWLRRNHPEGARYLDRTLPISQR